MVFLKLDPSISQLFTSLVNCSQIETSIKDKFSKVLDLGQTTVEMSLYIQAVQLAALHSIQYSVQHLQPSSLIFSEKMGQIKKKASNPDLIRRREQLQNAQKRQEYNIMISNILPSSSGTYTTRTTSHKNELYPSRLSISNTVNSFTHRDQKQEGYLIQHYYGNSNPGFRAVYSAVSAFIAAIVFFNWWRGPQPYIKSKLPPSLSPDVLVFALFSGLCMLFIEVIVYVMRLSRQESELLLQKKKSQIISSPSNLLGNLKNDIFVTQVSSPSHPSPKPEGPISQYKKTS